MAKLLRFPSSDGEIVVAVRTPGEHLEAAGLLDVVIETAEASFGEVFRMMGSVASSFSEELSRHSSVSSAEVEFGIQFTAKGNVYVVESTGQAALKVKLSLTPGRAAAAAGPRSASAGQ